MNNKFIQLAKKAANRMIYNDDTGSYGLLHIDKWEWAQGVGLLSLYRYYNITKELEYLNYIEKWFERHLTNGVPVRNVNTTSPLLVMTYLNSNGRFDEFIRDWAEYIMNEMPRTAEQGIQHVTSHIYNNQQLWADTLFMTCLFLARAGLILNREDMFEQAVYQFMLHTKYLTDKSTGLWYHGWGFEEHSHYGKALWGRGNAWFTAGVAELFDIANSAGAKIPMSSALYLKYSLDTQVSALSKLLSPDGLWRTLLNDNSSYEEASATAGIAYGIMKSIRLGILDTKYSALAKKALTAMTHKVSDDGTILNVSHGTSLGNDLDHYRQTPICPTVFGQALAILLFVESIGNRT